MNSLHVVSSLAGLFAVALGCNPAVTESNNDDVGDDTTGESDAGSGESSSTGESGTESTDTDEATGDDDPTSTDTTSTTSTTDADDTTDTGEGKHLCGWDPGNEWYFCGWEGADPAMEHAISCDEFGFPMVPGAACDGKLDHVGCCDAMGDAWYCLNGFIEYEVCGAG